MRQEIGVDPILQVGSHLKRVTYEAKLLSRNGVAAIAAFIFLYRNIRGYARKETTNFLEVYVKCSIEACARRDSKRLYNKASAGQVKNLTGPQDLYEEPLSPDLTVDMEKLTVAESVDAVKSRFRKLNLISRDQPCNEEGVRSFYRHSCMHSK
jgi:adenylylsulfate kinase